MSWGAPGEIWSLLTLGSMAASRAGEPVLGWAQGSGGDPLCRWVASQVPLCSPRHHNQPRLEAPCKGTLGCQGMRVTPCALWPEL